jgi:hypothetical protein
MILTLGPGLGWRWHTWHLALALPVPDPNPMAWSRLSLYGFISRRLLHSVTWPQLSSTQATAPAFPLLRVICTRGTVWYSIGLYRRTRSCCLRFSTVPPGNDGRPERSGPFKLDTSTVLCLSDV